MCVREQVSPRPLCKVNLVDMFHLVNKLLRNQHRKNFFLSQFEAISLNSVSSIHPSTSTFAEVKYIYTGLCVYRVLSWLLGRAAGKTDSGSSWSSLSNGESDAGQMESRNSRKKVPGELRE